MIKIIFGDGAQILLYSCTNIELLLQYTYITYIIFSLGYKYLVGRFEFNNILVPVYTL